MTTALVTDGQPTMMPLGTMNRNVGSTNKRSIFGRLEKVQSSFVLCLLAVLPSFAHGEQNDGAFVSLQAQSATQNLTKRLAPLSHASSVFRGSLSCAAVACHGGSQPGVADARSARGSEYPLWLESDPHARAALVLGKVRSKRMLEHLQIMKGDVIVNAAGYANCQACHQAGHVHSKSRSIDSSGNSCESCHGPADKWIGRHYARDWNRNLGTQYGAINTRDLLTRARMCADCHVGSRHREVNHDLIAAGHPPLRFELTAYHNRLPKHWRHEDEVTTKPEFQKQLWLAGQIASSEAALALLEARLDDTRELSVWPEFSEYNCGGCHHELRVNNARSTDATHTLIPTWGDWHYSVSKQLWVTGKPGDDGHVSSSFDQLKATMSTLGRPSPSDIRKLRDGISAWASRRRLSQLSNNMKVVVRDAAASRTAQGGIASWEEAAQTYLSLAALYAPALRRSKNDRIPRDALRSMNALLSLPSSRPRGSFFEPSLRADADSIRADEFRVALLRFLKSTQ